MTDQAHANAEVDAAPGVHTPPRWLSALGAITAAFTAMCCVGVPAAVSLSTAVGATFLTRDATLRPLLAATLGLTVIGSVLTFLRRRRPWPVAVTVAAALWIYTFVYIVGSGHSGHMADHMSDHLASTAHAGFSGPRLGAVWLGLAVLMGAQLSDLVETGFLRRTRSVSAVDAAP